MVSKTYDLSYIKVKQHIMTTIIGIEYVLDDLEHRITLTKDGIKNFDPKEYVSIGNKILTFHAHSLFLLVDDFKELLFDKTKKDKEEITTDLIRSLKREKDYFLRKHSKEKELPSAFGELIEKVIFYLKN